MINNRVKAKDVLAPMLRRGRKGSESVPIVWRIELEPAVRVLGCAKRQSTVQYYIPECDCVGLSVRDHVKAARAIPILTQTWGLR